MQQKNFKLKSFNMSVNSTSRFGVPTSQSSTTEATGELKRLLGNVVNAAKQYSFANMPDSIQGANTVFSFICDTYHIQEGTLAYRDLVLVRNEALIPLQPYTATNLVQAAPLSSLVTRSLVTKTGAIKPAPVVPPQKTEDYNNNYPDIRSMTNNFLQEGGKIKSKACIEMAGSREREISNWTHDTFLATGQKAISELFDSYVEKHNLSSTSKGYKELTEERTYCLKELAQTLGSIARYQSDRVSWANRTLS